MKSKSFITILAKSSSGDFYEVRIYLEENRIFAYCSCQAGKKGTLCKHVKAIVTGDETILYDKRQNKELDQIINHLPETPIPLLLSEIQKAEALMEEAKRNAKKAKKNLELVLLGKLKNSSKR